MHLQQCKQANSAANVMKLIIMRYVLGPSTFCVLICALLVCMKRKANAKQNRVACESTPRHHKNKNETDKRTEANEESETDEATDPEKGAMIKADCGLENAFRGRNPKATLPPIKQ